jgi:outer membrane protein TolC
MKAIIPIKILILLVLSGSAWGQQNTLSAKEAVVIALEKNFKVQIAEKQQQIAEMNNNWMEAGMFPTVTLNATFNSTIIDNTNNPFTFTPGVILNQGLTPSLVTNVNLFSGLAVHITKDRLEQLEEQSKGNALAVIETTIQDVLKAYYTASLQKERMQLFSTLKDYSRKRMEYYELKEKYAKTSSLELLQFRNQYLTDSTNFLMQEISWQNAMRNLLLLMNNDQEPDPTTFPELTDKLEIAFPLIDPEQSLADLKNNNQNLKNQYIALELQKTATQYQKSFLYPTLNFQAGVNPSWGWFRQLNVDNPMEIETQSVQYYGNFNLRYNLFNNWKTKRAYDVARIQEEIAVINTQQVEETLETTLRNLLAMYQIRTKLVDISQENLNYATKAYDLAKARFDMGTLTSIELETFRNNYQNTLMQHFENQFNKMDAFLEIYKMSGKLGLEYQ